jgi:hypothetical protein
MLNSYFNYVSTLPSYIKQLLYFTKWTDTTIMCLTLIQEVSSCSCHWWPGIVRWFSSNLVSECQNSTWQPPHCFWFIIYFPHITSSLTSAFLFFFLFAVLLHAMKAHGGERRYNSYSYLTSTLDGGEWSASCPGCTLPLGKKPPVPIGQEAGWAPEPVWTQRLEEKSSASVGHRTLVVQSIVSHYTDWAIPVPWLQL